MANVRISVEVWGTVIQEGGVADVHEQLRSGLLTNRLEDIPFVNKMGLREWILTHRLDQSAEGANVLWEAGQVVASLLRVKKGNWDQVKQWLQRPQASLKGQIPLDLLLTPLGQVYVQTAVSRF